MPPDAAAPAPSSQGPTPRWTRHQWCLVTLIALMHGLNHSFYVVMTPLFVSIQDSFGFDRLAPATFLATAFLAPYGVSHMFFGYASDRWRKSRILGFGGLAGSLFLLAAGLVPHYAFMLGAVACAGVAAATYHGVSTALVTTEFADSKGRALGLCGLGSALGLSVTPALSGWICQHYGWRFSFLAFGLGGALFSVFFLLTAREGTAVSPPHGQRTAWTPLLLLLLPIIGYQIFREFCGWGSFALIPSFAQKIHGFSPSRAGALGTCVTLAGIVAGPLFGVLSDRVPRAWLLLPLTAGAALGIAILPFLPPGWLFAGALVYGFFYLATVPVFDALIGDVTPNAVKGIVFGLLMSLGIGIGSLSPVATAAIADAAHGSSAGFRGAFLLLAASAALGLVPLLLQARRRASP